MCLGPPCLGKSKKVSPGRVKPSLEPGADIRSLFNYLISFSILACDNWVSAIFFAYICYSNLIFKSVITFSVANMVVNFLFSTNKLISPQTSGYKKRKNLHAKIFLSFLFLPGYMLLLFYKNVVLDPRYKSICPKGEIETSSTQKQLSTLILIWWGFFRGLFWGEVGGGGITSPLSSIA